MASRSSFFSVSFLSSISGEWTVSRHFSTRRAATAWARFLRTQSYVRDYAIHRGGPGGERLVERDARSRVTPDDPAIRAEVEADLAASKEVADDLAAAAKAAEDDVGDLGRSTTITSDMVSESGVHEFYSDASDLGFRAGCWPMKVRTTMGNGLPFVLSSATEECSTYRQAGGVLVLRVFND